MNKYEELSDLLDEYADVESNRPEACYCHHSPPCSRCCYEPSNDIQSKIDEFIVGWEDKE